MTVNQTVDYTRGITFRTTNSTYHLSEPDVDGWRSLTKESSEFTLPRCRITGQGYSCFMGACIEDPSGEIRPGSQLVLGLPEGSSHETYTTSKVVEVFNS